jgi:DNA polymerase III epsilon subunit-like protein
MPWTEQTIHFIDFEGAVAGGILEYGVVTLCGGQITATATRRCRPTGRVRAEDAALHGLTPETLRDEAPFADDFEFFARCRETGPLAAHFAGAEHSLLKSVWPYPRRSPDFGREGGELTDWGPWIDTGRLYPQCYAGLTSARLGDLVGVFQLQAELDVLAGQFCPPDRRRYHAALYDALAGALLLLRLAREPVVADKSVGWLLAMSTFDGDTRAERQQGELF